MDTPPALDEDQVAEQLPVISPQRDSLAAVLLTRWLRLAASRGMASLQVTQRRGRERWSLSWHTPRRQPKTLQAPTLAALYVSLLAELPPEEQRRWSGEARR